MPFQDFKISGFAGLNQDESPDQLDPNELTEALNTARNGSSYGTRPGLAFEPEATGNYSAAPAAGIVGGGFEMGQRANTNGNWMVTVVNGNAYRDSGSGVLDKTTNTVTISTTGRWTFAQHGGSIYAAGGANGDSIWAFDGNPANPLTKLTFQSDTNGDGAGDTAIDAKYILEKWNYIFLAGMNGTLADDNPMIVRYSQLGAPTVFPVGNSIGGSSAIGGLDSYGGNAVTGLAEFSAGGREWVLILTRKAIYSVVQLPDPDKPFYVDDTIANGCVTQQAFVSLGVDSGDAIYLSRKGVHSLRQSQRHGNREDAFLSWKIRPTFNGINFNTLANSSGVYWEREGVVLFAVPTGSATWPDLILCLDMKGIQELNARNARWSLWRPVLGSGVGITSMWVCRDNSSAVDHVYVGLSDGRVGRFQRTTYSDFGSVYEVKFRTKDDDHAAPRNDKGLGDILSTFQFQKNATVNYQPVFNRGTRAGKVRTLSLTGSVATWDNVTWDNFTWAAESHETEKKIYGTGSGRTVSHRFFNSNLDQPFFLTQIGYQLDLRDESLERDA